MDCPRCSPRIEMSVATAGPHGTAHACARCGGMWVDNAGSGQLMIANAPEIVRAADVADAAREHSHVDQGAHVRCPTCRDWLPRVREVSSGVVIDVCARHGTWFDHDEALRLARAFVDARAAARAPELVREPEPPPEPEPWVPPPPRSTRAWTDGARSESTDVVALAGVVLLGLSALPSGRRFIEVHAATLCTACGLQNDAAARWCKKCGAPIDPDLPA